MSKRIDRWSDTALADLVAGLVMLDPITGCEVVIRRVELKPEGALIEYEPCTVGVGYFVEDDRTIRTRKVENDG